MIASRFMMARCLTPHHGAWTVRVRCSGIRYETYDPMAEKELQRLATEALDRFDILAVRVEHSRGIVRNHACSFRLRIASAHRKEGLAAMDWYIDQMKKVVPIWKHAIPAEVSQESSR